MEQEEKVEFSWKRNRLYNHTACLVLYQMCMEVGSSDRVYRCNHLVCDVFGI